MKKMTSERYQQILQYLYAKLPMFSRVGAVAYKPDLSNSIRLSNSLGNPERAFKSIHIAGTNGKGSVSHMLASILQEAGYKVGLYTSPHLLDFRERIKINGVPIGEEEVIHFVEKCTPYIEEWQPSFFEVTVGMAFSFFAKNEVDIAVIEVGLGGLLDSTNIIRPELSVITNISFDHMALLGETLPEIAAQKAGIIKENIPVVIGENQPEILDIFISKAKDTKSFIHLAYEEWQLHLQDMEGEFLHLHIHSLVSHEQYCLELDLIGEYQMKNVVTVLSAVQQLKKRNWNIQTQHIEHALRKVKMNTGMKGRFDVLQHLPTVIADVAHNEAGLQEVLRQVKKMQKARLHIIIGFVKDKSIDAALQCFPQEANYYFTQAQIPRALDVLSLQQFASQYHLVGNPYSMVGEAFKAAKSAAHDDDIILITGSFFILEDIYKIFL